MRGPASPRNPLTHERTRMMIHLKQFYRKQPPKTAQSIGGGEFPGIPDGVGISPFKSEHCKCEGHWEGDQYLGTLCAYHVEQLGIELKYRVESDEK